MKTRRERAAELIARRGKSYRFKKTDHVTLYVWTKSLMDVDMLVTAYGGCKHTHKQGWYWYLGKKKDLLVVWEEVSPLLETVPKCLENLRLACTGPDSQLLE